MSKLLLTTAFIFGFTGSAFAQSAAVSGEVSLNFAENAAGNYAGDMELELGINAGGLASIDLDLSATDGNSVVLDNWTVATDVVGIEIALGDDNGLFPGAEGEHTLAAPAMAESVKLSYGGASVALGWTDWTNDLTDIGNVQGAYTLDAGLGLITAAGDYNLNTEKAVIGLAVTDVDVAGLATIGKSVTYDVDSGAIGYEVVADTFGITAYVNGSDTDALQNVGGEYSYMLGGAKLTAGANYSINAEEFAPSASISFAF